MQHNKRWLKMLFWLHSTTPACEYSQNIQVFSKVYSELSLSACECACMHALFLFMRNLSNVTQSLAWTNMHTEPKRSIPSGNDAQCHIVHHVFCIFPHGQFHWQKPTATLDNIQYNLHNTRLKELITGTIWIMNCYSSCCEFLVQFCLEMWPVPASLAMIIASPSIRLLKNYQETFKQSRCVVEDTTPG